MSLITRLNRLTVLRNIIANAQRDIRCISTSQKKSDTATISTEKTAEPLTDFSIEAVKKSKNWVYWGFDTKDKKGDENAMHATFFFTVTLCLVFGSFIYFYQPDFLLRDWAQREAFLELRRREAAGDDLISPNYVDPSLIDLPSDEELGSTEIII